MIPVNRRKPPPLAATVPEFWEEDAAALRESERDAPPPEADTERFAPEETALLHERVAEFRKHFNQPGPYLFYTVPGVEIREGTCQTCGERPVAWRLGGLVCVALFAGQPPDWPSQWKRSRRGSGKPDDRI